MTVPTKRKLIVGPEGRQRIFEIVTDRLVIGREAGVDIQLDDHRTSRRHCEVRRIGDLLLLEDLESANGTLVNGEPVRRTELKPGDRIQVGNVAILVDHVAAERPSPSVRPVASEPAAEPIKAGPRGARPGRRPPRILTAVMLLAAVAGLAWLVTGPLSAGEEEPAATPRGKHSRAEAPGTPDTPARDPASRPGQQSRPEDGFRKQASAALEAGRFLEVRRLLTAHSGLKDLEEPFQRAMDAVAERLEQEARRLAADENPARASAWLERRLGDFPTGSRAAVRLAGLAADGLVARRKTAAEKTGDAGPAASQPAEESRVAATASLSAAELMDQADAVLSKRDLTWASSLFLAGEEKAREKKDRELVHRAGRGLRLVQSYENLFKALGALPAEATRKAGRVPFAGGSPARVTAIGPAGIRIERRSGALDLKWRLVPAETLRLLASRLPLTPRGKVDAALVMHHAGRKDAALAFITQAFRLQARVKPAIDQALADMRGMPVPDGGFTLLEDDWLAPRELARSKLNATVRAARKGLMENDPAARARAFQTLLDLGEKARSSMHRGILAARIELVEKVEKTRGWKALSRLARAKDELNARRAKALELIFDEVKYPYPYLRSRGASAQAVMNFRRHAPIVRDLVKAVREAWEEPLQATAGKTLEGLFVRLRETDAWLDRAGFDPPKEQHPWLLHLPRTGPVTLRNFADDARDRERIDASAEIMKANEADPGAATRPEQLQVRITNEYRLMFGRWAVRISDALVRASRGHCQDMVKHGFFGHDSPVKGKENPYKRAVKAGAKPLGISENIAVSASPQGAHDSWIRSSGHHRNILGPSWRIMGPGQSGNRWCQVFSGGDANAKKAQEPR